MSPKKGAILFMRAAGRTSSNTGTSLVLFVLLSLDGCLALADATVCVCGGVADWSR